MNQRMVPGAGGNGRVLLQHHADAFERPERRVGNGIRHAVIGAAPAAFRPHEIVAAVVQEHKRSFDVAFRGDFPENSAIGVGLKTGEIGFQPHDVAMPPAAVNHIVLPVLVLENELVNGLRAVVKLIEQGFAEVIGEGAVGLVGNRYADAAAFGVVLNIVGGEEEEILLAFLDDGRRPHGFMGPFDGGSVQKVWVFFPVNQVFGGKGIQKNLSFIYVRPGGVNPVAIVKNSPFGVGIPAGE